MVSLLFVQQQHRAIVATHWSSTAGVLSFVCTTRSQKSGEQNLDGDVMSEQESGKHILKVLKLLETGEGEKFEVLSSTGFAARELRKDSLESIGVKENLELKQFACDFLSLFCSEVPPGESLRFQQKVHLNKRLIACKWMVFCRIGIWFIVPLQEDPTAQ